jgi:cell division protein FtsB
LNIKRRKNLLFKTRKRKISWIIALVIIAFIAYFSYFFGGFKTTADINSQVNQLIQNKNYNEIKKLSANDKTYKFLINLPKNKKCKSTSDAQGSEGNLSYYVTGLKNKNVGLYVEKETGLLRTIFPKWKILR